MMESGLLEPEAAFPSLASSPWSSRGTLDTQQLDKKEVPQNGCTPNPSHGSGPWGWGTSVHKNDPKKCWHLTSSPKREHAPFRTAVGGSFNSSVPPPTTTMPLQILTWAHMHLGVHPHIQSLMQAAVHIFSHLHTPIPTHTHIHTCELTSHSCIYTDS